MGRRALAAAFAAAAWALSASAGAAVASPGDLLRVVAAPAAEGGVSVAFDGQLLYYTNPGEPVVYRMTTTGVQVPPIVLKEAVPLQAIAYDATRNMFWGIDEDLGQRSVFLVDKAGNEALQFVMPELETIGCDNGELTGSPGGPGPCLTITGIAYDAHPDSIWVSPDGTQRIYHYDTVGNLLGWYDTNEAGQAIGDQCVSNNASGIAVANHGMDSNGGPTAITYNTAQDCRTWFRYRGDDDDTPIKQAWYPTWNGSTAEDAECDDVTFNVSAIWIRDFFAGTFNAFEAPYCTLGGGMKILDRSRMTGGGGLPVLFPPGGGVAHHGFMIHCDVNVQPDRLEVTWGSGNSFHMTQLDHVDCPPKTTSLSGAGFDTITGYGRGRVDGTCCGTVKFSFQDSGEPGTADIGDITVYDSSGCMVMHAAGALLTGPLLGEGNYQAHQGT